MDNIFKSIKNKCKNMYNIVDKLHYLRYKHLYSETYKFSTGYNLNIDEIYNIRNRYCCLN